MTHKIFLDTSALVELIGGSRKGGNVLAAIKASREVHSGFLNLYELWHLACVRGGADFADSAVIGVKNHSRCSPPSEEACLLAAKLRSAYCGKGIGAVDFITAASCIKLGAKLVTTDHDFAQIKELDAQIL
ncbi:MAG: PIN domain-containing protein [Candidatus Micrarchaeota archaeon]